MGFTRYESLRGRTVVITGGASGIGESFVRAFAANGARVAFLDIQQDVGDALVESVAASGEAPLFVPCDLTDIAALKAAFDRVEAALGPAAVLVNNAANDKRLSFEAVTEAEFDWVMAVNLKHVFFAAQAIVPQMRKLGFGSIINLSSVAWMRGVDDLEAYAAAKAAIVGFTNTLAKRVGPDRIRVNAIAPGAVLTERQRKLWFQDKAQVDDVLSRQYLREILGPDDIAQMALFLAADDSRMITTQTFAVNAGIF